jgi:cell division septation protein DedD
MMAPILIDTRDLIKLGIISVLTMVTVFAAGFSGGYQQATGFYATDSVVETLTLPVQTVSPESDVDPQLPDIIVAGAEIDVDQPQVESRTSTKNSAVKAKTSTSSNKEKVNKVNQTAASNKQASKEAVTLEPVSIKPVGKPTNKVSSDDKNSTNKNTQSSIKEKLAAKSFQNEPAKSAATKQPDLIVVASLTSAELNKIKYSIQVGMYKRLINAENMMRMLQAQHLNAYVSDYTSKKNESRYNVRFGYFVDKKSAITALKNYRNTQKGDGYLVNFSVENITKLADAIDLKQSTTTEKTEKKSSPATAPLETTGDAVSQAGVVSLQLL